MKILLAVDGSAHSLAACRYLATFPLPASTEVEILTVVNPPDVVLTGQTELWYPQFIEHQEEISRQAIESARAAISKLDAMVTSHQMTGHIGHCIVERAKEQQVNLVVVAAKGHSAFERVLLGSVSDYVATHATCSVLVVRVPTTSDGQPAQDVAAGNIGKAIIAVDEREVSNKLLDRICQFAWTADHHLTAVTASVKLEVFREDILATTMEEAARRRTIARRCADAAAARFSECGANAEGHSIEVEHVGKGLVEYAARSHSDLIVVGDTGRGAISRIFLGSTSRYVLHHVHCSVLIAR
ncbi:universal stress protein [Allorhodopirellula heiligendammensis]|uniref:Universal stress protein n=1 Tax=Allorhodopirellula heiligendammensis TaxID=2714739 RepID=A0A5C6BXK5_9BACT|nr:universal stress protein [Allorhodopirellula heiligendammensis]TWU17023.1 Universal stress protein [Allorhodopirellula heiligendammensis]